MQHRLLNGLAIIGPLLLLVVCTIHGVTEVHSSTDTYIGLAGGRAVLESENGFPLMDTMSYASDGVKWFNQNWLTHTWQYWLFKNHSPDAVVFGCWVMSTLIFVFSFLATWFRSRSVFASLIGASFVAYGCYNFISARPATTGYFALSAFWLLLCAIEGQGEKRRWWPIFMLPPLIITWGCAHGSFIFAYPMLVLYVGYWSIRTAWSRFLPGAYTLNRVWIDAAAVVVTFVGCYLVVGKVIPDPIRPPRLAPMADTWRILGPLILTGLLFVAFVRDRSQKPAMGRNQALGILAVLVISFLGTGIVSPFGFENFFHVKEVADSKIWRTVSEWQPPYMPGNAFPPVFIFWRIFRIAIVTLVVVGAFRAIIRLTGMARKTTAAGVDQKQPPMLNLTAFDVLGISIGLMMTMYARRFAPVFFIFASPVLVTWILNSLRPVPAMIAGLITTRDSNGASDLADTIRLMARWGLSGVAIVFAVLIWNPTSSRLDKDLEGRFKAFPKFGLLEKVSRYDAVPHEGIEYLKRNNLDANVLTEWTISGPVMFYAPNVRVYMDGRAQQVYKVAHYKRYSQLVLGQNTPVKRINELLDQFGTDIILLRGGSKTRNLWLAAERQPRKWALFMLNDIPGGRYAMFVRIASPVFQKVRELINEEKEWRPTTPAALMARGHVWQNTEPRATGKAINDWTFAVRRRPELGEFVYDDITRALILKGELVNADTYLSQQEDRVKSLRGKLRQQKVQALLEMLRLCRAEVAKAQEAGIGQRPAGG